MAAMYGAVSVTTTATLILVSDPARRGFLISNNGGQIVYIGQRDCGGCSCNGSVKGNRRKVFLSRLTVVPDLNWATLCQLVWQTHIG